GQRRVIGQNLVPPRPIALERSTFRKDRRRRAGRERRRLRGARRASPSTALLLLVGNGLLGGDAGVCKLGAKIEIDWVAPLCLEQLFASGFRARIGVDQRRPALPRLLAWGCTSCCSSAA